MPDESPARQTATALLVAEAVALGLSLPLDGLFWIGSLWESDDPARQQRLTAGLPLLGLVALAAAILCACAAASVWRDRSDAVALTLTSAVLAGASGVGWVVMLGDRMMDPVFLSACVVMSAVPAVALALLLRLRRRVRPDLSSPPR